MISKKELRREILQRRDSLTSEERSTKSSKITEKVIVQKAFLEADKILLFASYKSEVETWEIFKTARNASKDIYYPKVLGKEMEFYRVKQEADLLEGYHGIREPERNPDKKFVPQADEKICVIMPGAVFDEEGSRIGYGGGFYDAFLAKLEQEMPKENIYKMAVAYECQIVETGKIKRETHDIKPNCIVTENKNRPICTH